jgi:CYTH domain-containing protein
LGKEIERKFLVTGEPWKNLSPGTRYRQGYLSSQPERSVRVRSDGRSGKLTIKGITRGASRDEFEYEIPLQDAEYLLDQLCERPLIEKVRHKITVSGRTWEVDVFEGDNAGLVVAEIELEDEGQTFELPTWVSREVTDDVRYFNANLVRNPYRTWAR